jgi:hypothetical protein
MASCMPYLTLVLAAGGFGGNDFYLILFVGEGGLLSRALTGWLDVRRERWW